MAEISVEGRRRSAPVWIMIAIAMLLALLLITPSYGFDASGNTITAQVSPGTITASNGSSHMLGSSGVASLLNGGDLSGYFGFAPSQANETTPPNLILISPANDSVRVNSTVIFSFQAIDSSGLANCSLFVDMSVQDIVTSPSSGNNTLQASLSGGDHYWNISCYDTKGNKNQSKTRLMKVILASQFDNDTTDLTQVNLSNIPNLTLAKSNTGRIQFPTNTDLGGVTDLESHISISALSISVNATALPVLNKPATLTIYDVPYDNPIILKDGVVCTTCIINSFSSGRIVFEVTGFSTYTVTSTSRLEIFDDSDVSPVEIYETIGFYANYSNTSSGIPISAQCNISFNTEVWTVPVPMSYNSGSGLYEYYSSFNISDTYEFNISCHALTTGYDDLSAIDYVIVSSFSEGSLAEYNMSPISSERYDDSRPGASKNTVSGNITEVSFNTIITSQSWQGYYGNISNRMALADVSGNAIYNWNNSRVSGEIMATRNTSIDWASINCSSQDVINAEDIFLQKTENSSDSVDKTFNMTNHPAFLVSTSVISGCKSTRTFRNIEQTGFWNVLLSDSLGTAVYTGMIVPDNFNFKNATSDFELIVPVPYGTIQTYYFYLELN